MGKALAAGLFVVVWLVFAIVPEAQGLGGYVRLAFFHIPVAWVSVLAFFLSAFWALRYLRNPKRHYDTLSFESAKLGFIFCLLACASGAVFAKLTWGAYWNWDPRQTTIFILLLMYGAYLTLRQAVDDENKRARIAAVYSLFSFAAVPFLVFVIPRYYFSLHPEPVINSAGKIEMEMVMLFVLAASLLWCTALYFYLLYKNAGRESI